MKNKQQKLTLDEVYNTFKKGFYISPTGKSKAEALNLKYTSIDIGYNSGQIHHRRSEAYKEELLRLGIIKKSNAPSKTGKAYKLFGSQRLILPLRDKHQNIVNLCAINEKNKTETFLYDHLEGIYPMLLNEQHSKLYLTTSLLDAATIMSLPSLKSHECVIAFPAGKLTNYLKAYFKEAVSPTLEITVVDSFVKGTLNQ